MFEITKKLKNFSAAHRLVKGYEGRCKHLHGHNYAVDITIAAESLNEFDFVMDFDDIKVHFDQWVQDHWDHVTLVSEMDRPLLDFLHNEQQNYFMLPGNKNTTAERLSEFLFYQFDGILNQLQQNKKRLTLTAVRVYESDTASSTYSRSI